QPLVDAIEPSATVLISPRLVSRYNFQTHYTAACPTPARGNCLLPGPRREMLSAVLPEPDPGLLPVVSDERNLPMSQLRLGACALLVLLVSDSIARGQERPTANTAARTLAKVRHFRETALSPDGRRVAWVETFRAKDGASSAPSAIFIADSGA